MEHNEGASSKDNYQTLKKKMTAHVKLQENQFICLKPVAPHYYKSNENE